MKSGKIKETHYSKFGKENISTDYPIKKLASGSKMKGMAKMKVRGGIESTVDKGFYGHMDPSSMKKKNQIQNTTDCYGR